MINFRDLGGYKSIDGRKVKYGIFFRSGHLSDLSVEEKEYLKKLKIKNILDYRTEEEIRCYPTPELDNITNIRITAMDMTTKNGLKFGSVEDMIKTFLYVENSFQILKENYYNLPINNPSYKKLVEFIKNPEMLPILNHCTAGKDRTGVGCAIILMLLGVSREDIVKDYLKSNDYTNESIKEFLENNPYAKDAFFKIKNDGYELPIEKLNYIFGVNEDYINASFQRIDEEYQSTEDFLKGEFNLTERDIKDLRGKYLE
ncbi:tyrosine-protein phosphatase [Romboutsia weinsteinii]|uniref:Tyrosine-protein phosphatase n=1 Tax=Romboutsia weinsteinii TaxID=2020949 RepID=A0A371J9H1_9FIRM|nr:tyrosine-protein phosphatase [Romboutsia weinsteinii]RDY29337.1 tyrosine-protein phosphatase [Romboutsia weinsteinii]